MKTNWNSEASRTGFTLLELATSTALLAVLASSCMVLVRTSYTAWNRHEDNHTQQQSGVAVVNHITRRARQCRSVLAISVGTDTSGTLMLLAADGRVLVWDHDSGSNEVLFGEGTADQLLATGIKELKFEGIKLDGSTLSVDPGLIHSIRCTSKVDIERPTSTETVTFSSHAWLRAW